MTKKMLGSKAIPTLVELAMVKGTGKENYSRYPEANLFDGNCRLYGGDTKLLMCHSIGTAR